MKIKMRRYFDINTNSLSNREHCSEQKHTQEVIFYPSNKLKKRTQSIT